MADKHVCKFCGAKRSGHECAVAKRWVPKDEDGVWVIAAVAVAAAVVADPDAVTAAPNSPADEVPHGQRAYDPDPMPDLARDFDDVQPEAPLDFNDYSDSPGGDSGGGE